MTTITSPIHSLILQDLRAELLFHIKLRSSSEMQIDGKLKSKIILLLSVGIRENLSRHEYFFFFDLILSFSNATALQQFFISMLRMKNFSLALNYMKCET